MSGRVVLVESSDEDLPSSRQRSTPRLTRRPTRSISASGSRTTPRNHTPAERVAERAARAPAKVTPVSRLQNRSRKSTGTSAEPRLASPTASAQNTIEVDDSSRAASPPFGQLTPIEYDYVDESERSTPKPGDGHLDVEIDFQPLDVLNVDYVLDLGLTAPSAETREWLLKEQKNAPRSPRRRPPPRDAKGHQSFVAESSVEDTRDGTAEGMEIDRLGDPVPVDARDDDNYYDGYQSEAEDDDDEPEDSEVEIVTLPRRTRQQRRDKSSSPEIVMTRAQQRSHQQDRAQKQQSRKRQRASSRESNQSYNPYAREEGESEVDDWSQSESETETERYSPTRRKLTGAVGMARSQRILEKHREFCEKCQRGPADVILHKALKKKKGAKRRRVDEDRYSEEEEARMMGGWLECERCVLSSHWGCLPEGERRDVLNVFRARFPDAPPRKSITIEETASFTCGRCNDYPVCFVCKERHIPGSPAHVSQSPEKDEGEATLPAEGASACSPAPDAPKNQSSSKDKYLENQVTKSPLKGKSPAKGAHTENDDSQHQPIAIDSDNESRDPIDCLRSDRSSSPGIIPMSKEKTNGMAKTVAAPLLFRCFRCQQAVHYEHLRNPFDDDEDHSLWEIAAEYQSNNEGASWYCHCCRDWKWLVDKILAWRPLPADAVEPEREPGELPHWKDRLPREYLVKFRGRSFRHVAWVPHAWLLVVAGSKLRNFLEKGPKLDLVTDSTLAARGDQMANPTIVDVLDEAEEEHGRAFGEQAELEAKWEGHGPPPDENADESIPLDWSTVDRLLDVYLRPPPRNRKSTKVSKKNRIESSESSDDEPEIVLKDGVQPPEDQMVEIGRWENMAGRKLDPEDVDEIAPKVTWFYAKWDDLQYDQSCWDTPPPKDDPRYPGFKRALARFLAARQVVIPVLGSRACNERDYRAEEMAKEEPPDAQPECVVGGRLMPFQLEGFQWLLYKHWSRESCILADDMGLGKTIQVCSFLGYLCSEEHQIYPHLVIVPNSTISNWVREFEKWVPHVRVVPYYGETASRKVIHKHELFHLGKQGKADGLKAHVVLTTYDTVTGAEFRVFSNIPRWETLVVDEGQRLKSDASLMFNKLKQLNSMHRVLLTGTPLNNNLRELFNLLNFLDPENFRNLEELEARFELLNEGLVVELHNMLKSYILRRIKAQVLKLPPKVEIIVPISMTSAQKRLTKLVLQRSAEVISGIRKKRKQQLAAQKRKKLEAMEAADASEVENGIETAPKSGEVSAVRSPDQAAETAVTGETTQGEKAK